MTAEIIVVGGGAAGMYAACEAAGRGARVSLVERNRLLGVKLNITGKGRCNVTNRCGGDTLIAHVPRNGKFLYSAFAACTPEDVIALLEGAGVPMKVERGNRVFPVSDRAKDVSGALKTLLVRRGVKLVQGRVAEVLTEGGRAVGVRLEDGRSLAADRVILATGGVSYPRTGSSGDGFAMARALGHTVTPLRPSLVPLVSDDGDCVRLEGLSLRNIALRAERGGKLLYSDFGEMLFTGNGVSGPVILSASAHLGGRYPCTLAIDLKPALDFQALDRRLVRDFSQASNRDFSNALGDLLPAKMIPVVVDRSGILARQKVNGITRQQREALGRLIKRLEIGITGPGPMDEAVVTSGGVSVAEIDPKTMMSRKVQSLYFAGEIMDVDAYTGGFNLQIAWSTGFLAGASAARAE